MKSALAVLGILFALSQERPLAAVIHDSDRRATEQKTPPATIAVAPGGDVQRAVNTAKCGDTVVLTAGARYVLGELTLPAKTCPVTLTSSATLPERRIESADAPLLPILASGNNGHVINGTKAAHWRLIGLQLEAAANGAGEVVTLQDANDIVMDRLLIVGGPNGQKRAIRGNGTNITLTRSRIANIWAAGQDSQAFCAWDGAGPYTLSDNYLEAASENVMFGGSDSRSAERIPADILVEGNLFTKRLEWKPVPPATVSGKAVKNLFELKAARRVIVRKNTFERSWTDAQTGYAISFKSVNQGGTAPWSVTEDVLFENNVVRDVANGFNIQGVASDQPGGRTTRITIRGNDVQTAGVAVQITGGPGAVTIDRTTFVNGSTFLQLGGSPIASLTVTNTLANHNAYGVKGDGTAIGTPSLGKFAPGYVWKQNVLLGGAGKGSYPAETWFDTAAVPAGVSVGR
jgi:hypothetical protein